MSDVKSLGGCTAVALAVRTKCRLQERACCQGWDVKMVGMPFVLQA